ncbi:MAG: PAS domain-containing protein [Candidatus Marithrix sp.]
MTITPIKNSQNQIINFIAVKQNITDYKSSNKALVENKNLHNLILENISDTIFITDNSGKFTYICPSINIIFGS